MPRDYRRYGPQSLKTLVTDRRQLGGVLPNFGSYREADPYIDSAWKKKEHPFTGTAQI